MSIDLETRLEYPPVIGWRERVAQTRRVALPAIAAAALSVTLLVGAGLANRDQVYGSLPAVAEARASWSAQHSYTRLAGLLDLQEPFGVNENREIVDTTIDQVVAILQKYGVKLRFSPDEFKSQISWLSEKEYVDRHVKIQTEYGNSYPDMRKRASMSFTIYDNSNRAYFNSGFIRQQLAFMGSSQAPDRVLRAYQSQMVIDRILQLNKPQAELNFAAISYQRNYQAPTEIYSQMRGLQLWGSGYNSDRFERAARGIVAQQLLAQLPGLTEDSYIDFPFALEDMRKVKSMHTLVGINPQDLIDVYLEMTPLNRYVQRLGAGGDFPFQVGIQKIIDFSYS